MNLRLNLVIESYWEAEQLSYVLIELEGKLQENPDGHGHIQLADKLNLARRRLQESAGLVVPLKRIEDMFRKRNRSWRKRKPSR